MVADVYFNVNSITLDILNGFQPHGNTTILDAFQIKHNLLFGDMEAPVTTSYPAQTARSRMNRIVSLIYISILL